MIIGDFILVDIGIDKICTVKHSFIYHCAVDMLVAYLLAVDIDLIEIIVYLHGIACDTDDSLDDSLVQYLAVEHNDIVTLRLIAEVRDYDPVLILKGHIH